MEVKKNNAANKMHLKGIPHFLLFKFRKICEYFFVIIFLNLKKKILNKNVPRLV